MDTAGGRLESHPRLTDTVLYRAADSSTIMKHALVHSECKSGIRYDGIMHNNFLVDSKEAKAKINTDVSPVQIPGKSNDQEK